MNHLKSCTEIGRIRQDSLDSMSDTNEKCDDDIPMEESTATVRTGIEQLPEKHPMENKVFVWNKVSNEEQQRNSMESPSKIERNHEQQHQQNHQQQQQHQQSQQQQKHHNQQQPIDENLNEKKTDQHSNSNQPTGSENGYYGVETAPGYGEVTKKMTPEEEAANSSLKKSINVHIVHFGHQQHHDFMFILLVI